MSLSPPEGEGALRRERLRTARLYLCCEARPGGAEPEALLAAALRGGVDIVQLREKQLPRREIERAAQTFRRLCDVHNALFIVNDDPDLARSCDADGVHVGQDDMAVAEAREILGPDAIIGLSTHSKEQLAAAGGASPVDYVSVGPIWETPTKEGRPAVGLGLIPTPRRTRRTRSSRSAASTRGNAGRGGRRRSAANLRGAGDPRRGRPDRGRRKLRRAFAAIGEAAPGA